MNVVTRYDYKRNLERVNQKYTYLYSKYVENKNVVIVGPAKSIMQSKQGEFINSFDCIVRLNKSLPIQRKYEEYVGSRTDILYNSLNVTDYPGENNLNKDFLKSNYLKFVCCSYPLIKPFDNDIIRFVNHCKYELPFRYVNHSLFNSMVQNMKTRPFTGLCAIIDLLQYNIKSLYITGLDFYHSNYYKKSIQKSSRVILKNRNNSIHNSNNQMKYLKYLSLIDNRIILDRVLDNLLYYDYYAFMEGFQYYLPIKNKHICFLGMKWNSRYQKVDYSEYDYVISFQNLDIPNLIYIDLKNVNFNGIGFSDKHKYSIKKYVLKSLNHFLLKLNIRNISLELYVLMLLLCNRIRIYGVNFSMNQNINLFFLFLIKKNIINLICKN